jgi:phosphate transport system permease protein
MMTLILITLFILLILFSYYLGSRKAVSISYNERLISLPSYYGYYVAIWCGTPALFVCSIWTIGESWVVDKIIRSELEQIYNFTIENSQLYSTEIRNIASGMLSKEGRSAEILVAAERYSELETIGDAGLITFIFSIALTGLLIGRAKIKTSLKAREFVEKTFTIFLFLSSTLAILTTIGIVFSLIFESLRFFESIPLKEFLFGTKWYPHIAIREGQSGAEGTFGAVPLLLGTTLISLIAILVAGPIGLFSAIYLAEYSYPRTRFLVKPMLEILAGIPTVVYGFFAALTVAPMIRESGQSFGLDVSAQSALAAGSVMGIMIIPFVSSLSDDVINAVPQSLREASLALGATKSETIKQVILPAALPGIVSAFLLALSRAIGETMIVVMAAGLTGNLTVNPLQHVTTVTVQIVIALVGDQEFDDPKTLSSFALGLLLFLITLILNIVAYQVVKRFREKYE